MSGPPEKVRPIAAVHVARNVDELAQHFAVRHEVFVGEQGIFTDDDRDVWDESAIHVVAEHAGVVVGTVRLYPLDEAGLWQGDRLAVTRAARLMRAGPSLVRFAVATAGELGGHLMLARVQQENVNFFLRLGWTTVGGLVDYRGFPHQRMTIPLAGAQTEAPADLQWALPA